MKTHARSTPLKLPTLLLLTGFFLAGNNLPAQSIEGVIIPFREVIVGSPLQKVIEEVHVEEGQYVSRGELLATLDSRVEALEVDRTAKVLERRTFEFEGAENLFQDEVISEDEALAARIERDIAGLQHHIARERYQTCQILSPLNGIVVDKFKESGEAVDVIENILRIVDIEQVFLQVFLEVSDYFHLEEGQEVTVRITDLPEDRDFTGTVDFIDPRVDGGSGLLRVKVLIPNPEGRILAGMRGLLLLPKSGD